MNKVLNIFFIFFLIILFPLNEVLRIDLQNNTAITGMDIGVSIVSIFGLFVIVIKKEKKHFSLVKPLLFFACVGFVALMINIPHLKQIEFFVAFLYLLRWIIYGGLYVVVSSLPEREKLKIPLYMMVSGVVILLLGFLQFFLYPNLRNLAYLGWDVHLYRMFGTFLDPNFFGAFLVLYFIFLLRFYVGNGLKLFHIRNMTMLFLLLFTSVGIILTYSRSAYVMLAVGLGVFFFMQKFKITKRVLLIALVVIAIGVASYFFFTKYSEGTNLFRVTSTQARIGTSEHALIIFEKNPILGVGFDAYRYAQKRYGFIQSSPQQAKIIADHGAAGADNSWLFVLATTGIVGFLAYVYLWINILCLGGSIKNSKIARLLNCSIAKKNINGTMKQWNNGLSPMLLSSSIALFINCFFINSLFYPAIMVWMWMLVGLSE